MSIYIPYHYLYTLIRRPLMALILPGGVSKGRRNWSLYEKVTVKIKGRQGM